MNEKVETLEPKNRVLGRRGLLELLGIAAARLTTVRRSVPAIPSREHIHIDLQQHEALRRLASERQTTVSALVGTAIQDWLARETKQPKRKTPTREAPRRTSPRQRKETKKERSKVDKPAATAGSGETQA
ncbi:MAG: hypothetical protein ACE1Z6_00180 [Candidatus Methylomirabilales bacterium]|nr:hypothetical protein [candidate division NC10 bacterium]